MWGVISNNACVVSHCISTFVAVRADDFILINISFIK